MVASILSKKMWTMVWMNLEFTQRKLGAQFPGPATIVVYQLQQKAMPSFPTSVARALTNKSIDFVQFRLWCWLHHCRHQGCYHQHHCRCFCLHNQQQSWLLMFYSMHTPMMAQHIHSSRHNHHHSQLCKLHNHFIWRNEHLDSICVRVSVYMYECMCIYTCVLPIFSCVVLVS